MLMTPEEALLSSRRAFNVFKELGRFAMDLTTTLNFSEKETS